MLRMTGNVSGSQSNGPTRSVRSVSVKEVRERRQRAADENRRKSLELCFDPAVDLMMEITAGELGVRIVDEEGPAPIPFPVAEARRRTMGNRSWDKNLRPIATVAYGFTYSRRKSA